jgi:hypothetical protein
MFWRNVSPPSSGLKNKPSKPAFSLVSCSAYSLTVKMEVTCPLKTSVDFNRLHIIISQKTELYIYVMGQCGLIGGASDFSGQACLQNSHCFSTECQLMSELLLRCRGHDKNTFSLRFLYIIFGGFVNLKIK